MRTVRRALGVVLALATLGGATALGASGGGRAVPPDALAAKVLAAAAQHVGEKYVYGATGPSSWDCSGLTSVLWRTVGGVASIPRVSRQQQAWAWPLRAADALPGDLVFFGDPVTHVGLYEGDGRIVDASSSKGQVVERALWRADVVRYGRVPRPGVPHPAPLPPPAPKPPAPGPKPSPAPSPSPAPKGPSAPKPAPAPAPKPAPAPVAKPHLNPIPPAGHQPRTATTKEMAAFVAALRRHLGAGWAAGGTGPAFDAAGLVRTAWYEAGFRALPATPAAIERLATPVALRDLAVGDLVLYGAPAVHVAVYVGDGLMIDASKVLRVVSRRRVFASETVRFARLVPKRR
jgi:cell wall-associated NlpC family hydrolase